ncbi:hypothetical protein FRB99_000405 [Tulasnella sp. 403]|nr:hypothetical protein FRB99_000405 [Tulasnella sp. 403]
MEILPVLATERETDRALLQAIHFLEHGTRLVSDDDIITMPMYPLLGKLFLRRYTRTKDPNDLEQSLTYLQVTFATLPPSHPIRIMAIEDFTEVLHLQYERSKDIGHIDVAIEYYQEAVGVHPDRPHIRVNFGGAIMARYHQVGDTNALERALGVWLETLKLCPPGQPDRPATLNNIGIALTARFKLTGDKKDIESSIEYLQESVSLRPPACPERSFALKHLADAISARFTHLNDIGDLEIAIRHCREALSYYHPDDTNRLSVLCELGVGLQQRFQWTGNLADVDDAIRYLQEAIMLCPTGGSDYANVLNNLAIAFQFRHQNTGNSSDLDISIRYHEEVLSLEPAAHAQRGSTLCNVAAVLLIRFDVTSDMTDLNTAIQYLTESELSFPPNHPRLANTLNNLGLALWTRYERLSALEDLDTAIKCDMDVLQFKPSDNRVMDHRSTLLNLGSKFRARFYHTRNREDLESSISFYRRVVDLCREDHAQFCGSRMYLARSMHERLHLSTEGIVSSGDVTSDMVAEFATIVSYLKQASQEPSGPLLTRLQAACLWANTVRLVDPTSALEAFGVVLELLDATTARTHLLEMRHNQLSSTNVMVEAKRLVTEAASLAIQEGQLARAVEFLEHGRVVLLTQISRYRVPLDDLRALDPELAERHRRLTMEWNDMLDEIRRIEGLEDFLKPTPFSKLKEAAIHGPIIIVNVSRTRSDALIVLSTSEPILVPLPFADPEIMAKITTRLDAAVKGGYERNLILILQDIWDAIVEPVVEVLRKTVKLKQGSRIWWYPTPAVSRLPLHAAGLAGRKGHSVVDLYTSSYTPTLGALIRARQNMKPSMGGPPQMLVVGQPNTPGQVELPEVEKELRVIQRYVPNATVLSGSQAVHSTVLSQLVHNRWVHFSCHGHVHPSNPLASHFSMYDEPLTLLQLVQRHLPHAELAVLSACHSASAGYVTPDEYLNLAGGMVAVGFGSVVGTLWAMYDMDGPALAEGLYKGLVGGEGVKEGKGGVAGAVRDVVKKMRRSGVAAVRWMNFVHYGV